MARLERGVQGRRDSLPSVNYVVRRRFSGTVMLPPLSRRESCQDHSLDNHRPSAVNGLPLDRLEQLYKRALASHDEHRFQCRWTRMRQQVVFERLMLAE